MLGIFVAIASVATVGCAGTAIALALTAEKKDGKIAKMQQYSLILAGGALFFLVCVYVMSSVYATHSPSSYFAYIVFALAILAGIAGMVMATTSRLLLKNGGEGINFDKQQKTFNYSIIAIGGVSVLALLPLLYVVASSPKNVTPTLSPPEAPSVVANTTPDAVVSNVTDVQQRNQEQQQYQQQQDQQQQQYQQQQDQEQQQYQQQQDQQQQQYQHQQQQEQPQQQQ